MRPLLADAPVQAPGPASAVCARPPRRALGLLALMALVGCSGQQPDECQVMLNCLYPPDGVVDPLFEDRYAQCADDPWLVTEDGDTPNRDAILSAFGTNGSCWTFGESDAYYQSCLEACRNILIDDCVAAEDLGTRFCQEAVSAVPELPQTCEDYRLALSQVDQAPAWERKQCLQLDSTTFVSEDGGSGR